MMSHNSMFQDMHADDWREVLVAGVKEFLRWYQKERRDKKVKLILTHSTKEERDAKRAGKSSEDGDNDEDENN